MSQLSQFEFGVTPVDNQVGIQFEDEGVALGTQGTVDTLDFTGVGVTATRAGNKVTVNVSNAAGAPFTTVDITKNIPADFATLALAIADYTSRVYLNGAQYHIEITAGHTVTDQIVIDGDDYSNLHITALGAGCTVDGTGWAASPLGFPCFLFVQDGGLGEIAGTFTGVATGTAAFLANLRSQTRYGGLVDTYTQTGFNYGLFCGAGRHASLTATIIAETVHYAIYNATVSNVNGTSTGVMQCEGSVLEVSGGTVTAASGILPALFALNGGVIQLSGPTITGLCEAVAGDIVGTMTLIEHPAGNINLLEAPQAGLINVRTSVSLKAGSTAFLAVASEAGRINVHSTGVAGTSTGQYADVSGASNINVFGAATIAAFGGGASQPLYAATANGLIIA